MRAIHATRYMSAINYMKKLHIYDRRINDDGILTRVTMARHKKSLPDSMKLGLDNMKQVLDSTKLAPRMRLEGDSRKLERRLERVMQRIVTDSDER